MIDLSISELLGKANLLLGKAKAQESNTNYSSPVRRRTWANFLSDDKEERSINYYRHVYFIKEQNWWEVFAVNERYIVHGHGPLELCATPFFCHQYGYWPKPTDHPMFVKNFLLKWKEVYEK